MPNPKYMRFDKTERGEAGEARSAEPYTASLNLRADEDRAQRGPRTKD